MGKYIERSAAIKAAIEGADDWDGGYNVEREEYLSDYINAIPAADVRPVVLCRDCKHGKLPVPGAKVHECSRLLNPMLCSFLVKPDWFCAFGERKDDDDE